MEKWDPIGVKDVPEAADEYDTYVGKVCAMVWENAPADKILTYLSHIEREYMGLGGDDLAVRKRLEPMVQEILDVFQTIKE